MTDHNDPAEVAMNDIIRYIFAEDNNRYKGWHEDIINYIRKAYTEHQVKLLEQLCSDLLCEISGVFAGLQMQKCLDDSKLSEYEQTLIERTILYCGKPNTASQTAELKRLREENERLSRLVKRYKSGGLGNGPTPERGK